MIVDYSCSPTILVVEGTRNVNHIHCGLHHMNPAMHVHRDVANASTSDARLNFQISSGVLPTAVSPSKCPDNITACDHALSVPPKISESRSMMWTQPCLPFWRVTRTGT